MQQHILLLFFFHEKKKKSWTRLKQQGGNKRVPFLFTAREHQKKPAKTEGLKRIQNLKTQDYKCPGFN